MKIDRKHMGLLLVSFIALSFNSHFAQAAKKTQSVLQPAKVYAFKKQGDAYHQVPNVAAAPVTVKKTAIRVDRNNVYIGGYVVNTSDHPVTHVRIKPTFATNTEATRQLAEQFNHDELNLKGREIRRFVIMRPIAEVKQLLENNVPLDEKCMLNCQVLTAG